MEALSKLDLSSKPSLEELTPYARTREPTPWAHSACLISSLYKFLGETNAHHK